MKVTKKVFCENCRCEVDYIVTSVQTTENLGGKQYPFIEENAHCVDCGSFVSVPGLSDANLQRLYDVYRRENGIIPLEQIREIPKKYAIGKRPLSTLLGWGEQTFSRYYDGDVPTRQYSDVLMRIYSDPMAYSELLEANKGNLKSSLTYERSRKVVDTILSEGNSSELKIASEETLAAFEMKIADAYQKGRAESVRALMESLNHSFDAACEILKVPGNERAKIKQLIKQ